MHPFTSAGEVTLIALILLWNFQLEIELAVLQDLSLVIMSGGIWFDRLEGAGGYPPPQKKKKERHFQKKHELVFNVSINSSFLIRKILYKLTFLLKIYILLPQLKFSDSAPGRRECEVLVEAFI